MLRPITFVGHVTMPSVARILSRVGCSCVIYRQVLDWMIGLTDTLYFQLLIRSTCNTALSLIYTLYSSPLHAH
jgi:hypothetical protein